MPFALKDHDLAGELDSVNSAVVVPCRFCPAANLAMREDAPYIDLFRHFLRTPAYESYIRMLVSRLEQEGVQTGVFDSRLPQHFFMCMWGARRKQALRAAVTGRDAAIVLGCDAAVETARDALKDADCPVIPGMDVEGIMSVVPSLRLPGTLSLGLTGVSRLGHLDAEDVPSTGETA